MGLYLIERRLKEVFRIMGVKSITITDFREIEDKKTFISVLLIFRGFQGIRTLNRVKIINRFLMDKAPELFESCMFTFECFTAEEYHYTIVRKNIHL